MGTFAKQQNRPTKPGFSNLAGFDAAAPGSRHRADFGPYSLHSAGNRASPRPSPTDAGERDFELTDSASLRFGHDFSRIPVHPPAMRVARPKLAISEPKDEYERQADRVSEQVMRMPEPRVQRACACGGGCPKCRTEQSDEDGETARLKRVGTSVPAPATAPPVVDSVLRSSGRPLDPETRAFMEPRFDRDFGRVRVHTGPKAGRSAAALAAQAYTVGSHIVFGSNQYVPASDRGRRLIAHELAHVVQQQNAASPGTVVQRQGFGEVSSGDADLAAEREYGDSGAPKAQKCGRPSHCPPGFCDPYRSEKLAEYYRAKNSGWIMLGISAAVSSRVVPFWREYLNGGSAPKNLSAQFGGDFTKSPTTKKATTFLHQELEKKLKIAPPNVPEFTTSSIDVRSQIPSAIAELDDPASRNRMNFNIPKDIPGNLAGDIGKDQTSCPAGAKPSPFNDERLASGHAKVVRSGSNITVTPAIDYVVKDTIDLCPGDCGTRLEQFATVPLSQFEATGISGDVPFTVEFPAPLGSFTVPAPPSSSSGSGSGSGSGSSSTSP